MVSGPSLQQQLDEKVREIKQAVSGISEEQLNRKARAPQLKETPMGEYPTLGQLAVALINFHLNDHVNQLRNLSQQ